MAKYLIRVRLQWEKVPAQLTRFPNASPHGPKASLVIDWDNKIWVARENWQELRDFLKEPVVTGSVNTSLTRGKTVPLLGRRNDPVLILDYFDLSGSAPALEGNAFWSKQPSNPNLYALRTYWWRVRDVSIMSPYDRLAEMIDIACTDPALRDDLEKHLGAFANPVILLPMAGIFLVFVGAEYLGGAAFVYAVQAILGVGNLAADVAEYESHFRQLNKILLEPRREERDLIYGAKLIKEILVRLLQDLVMALGMHALGLLVRKLCAAFMEIAPEEWRTKAKDKHAEAQSKAARNKATRHGYGGEHHLKDPNNVQMTHAEVKAHSDAARDSFQVIVVREGSEARAQIARSQVWHGSKHTWLKAKSSDGFHGFVCLEKGDWSHDLKPAGTYNTGDLLGISKEIDNYVQPGGQGQTRRLPMYELPTDGRKIPDIDYENAGAGKAMMQGHYLVDLGTHNGKKKFMVVNKTQGPIAADVDIAARIDPHAKGPGHYASMDTDPKVRNPEDSAVLEYDINRRVWENADEYTNRPTTSANHGGRTGSAGHAAMQDARGQGHWKPFEKNGEWIDERLVVFLPVKSRTGRPSAQMFVINNWADLQSFWKANHWEWPRTWNK
ncbi:hypothetical protein [Labrenzia sp. DG1229]|uniref:hypothetical protein n=1 Tax=Labrenzia sp. DG1229 TaxID=681847 RepID=UPI0012EB2028|nr:hypothetical protein [Labrenzia sp. DG1229]